MFSNALSELMNFATEDDVRSSVRGWSVNCGADKRLASKNLIRCHAYVTEGNTCIRVNTLPAYTYINREVILLFMHIVFKLLRI